MPGLGKVTAPGQDARMASVFIARGGSISVSRVQIVSSGGQRRSAMGGVIVIIDIFLRIINTFIIIVIIIEALSLRNSISILHSQLLHGSKSQSKDNVFQVLY